MKYEEVKCPQCGVWTFETSFRRAHTSIWGVFHKICCGECEHEFTLRETVTRSYEYVTGGDRDE